MITQGDGGGSTTEICTVSNSDLAGQIDNLLSRVEKLEKTVSELLASNTQAIQLSDLSQSVGWVYDVTYMGVEGWTQTAAGSLIPPAGVTWSSLGILPDSSQLYSSGTGVSGIGGGGTFSVSRIQIATSTSAITSVTEISDTNNITSISGNNVVIATSGYYLFLAYGTTTANTTTTNKATLYLYDGSFTLNPVTVCQVGWIYPTGISSASGGVGGAGASNIPSDSFTLTPVFSQSGSQTSVNMQLSIVKLS